MLAQPGIFFMDVKTAALLGPNLTQSEVDGCNVILDAMEGAPVSHAAYALATAYHETAHTMQPVTEFGGPTYLTRMYDINGARPQTALHWGNVNPGDGCRYCGRGYVQLTWRNNYRELGRKLGYPLEAHPELALSPKVAAAILRRGMDEGLFTGHGFDAYLPNHGSASFDEFVDARRIINGTDKAQLIAGYAMNFQSALVEGGWQ